MCRLCSAHGPAQRPRRESVQAGPAWREVVEGDAYKLCPHGAKVVKGYAHKLGLHGERGRCAEKSGRPLRGKK